MFWLTMMRLLRVWKEALVIVQPATAVKWHRRVSEVDNRVPAGLVLVMGFALSACVAVPPPDPSLTAQSFALAEEVAEILGVEPRKVPAAWTARIASSGGNYVERDHAGRETYRLILVHQHVEPHQLRALLAHELVHAHVADRGLSLLEEEGLCIRASFLLDPGFAADFVPYYEAILTETDLDLAWARTIDRERFEKLSEHEQSIFYALAYFDVEGSEVFGVPAAESE